MALDSMSDPGLHHRLAVQILRSRRQCRLLFSKDQEIFGEPVWDILPRLFISFERRDKITLSHLARSTDLPITTAQRRTGQLNKLGLLIVYPDDVDTRRRLVRLTHDAAEKMRQYLDRHYVVSPSAPEQS